MDWITKNIAIGNIKDARDAASVVDAVLCLIDCCDEENDDIDILCVLLEDGKGNKKHEVELAVDFIDSIVSSGERILVHCQAGRSRSVCIVAAYLVLYNGIGVNDALSLIQSKREIYLSDGILQIFDLCGIKTNNLFLSESKYR